MPARRRKATELLPQGFASVTRLPTKPARARQPVPRPPSHFTEAERKAWRDICRPLCEHGVWAVRLTLWAESFAVLLALSRADDRHAVDARKVNRSQLRLYANDLRHLIDTAPPPAPRNPFDDV